MRSFYRIMHNRWQGRTSNLEVLDRVNSTSIEATMLLVQLHWTGHLICMNGSRIPRQLFYGELSTDSRKLDRPKKRYKDNVKMRCEWTDLLPRELKDAALELAGVP